MGEQSKAVDDERVKLRLQRDYWKARCRLAEAESAYQEARDSGAHPYNLHQYVMALRDAKAKLEQAEAAFRKELPLAGDPWVDE